MVKTPPFDLEEYERGIMPKRNQKTGNGTTNSINFNRVLHKSDYEVFGVANRKGWEVSMALKTLREFGAVHPESLILGVGAAVEPTIYHLSNDVQFVFATDLYLDMGHWTGWAGKDFLINPAQYAGNIPCNPQRIIPQHMDMTSIHYPDNTFDGVFSSGSIEHVGTNGKPDYSAIAQAAKEIGRVTKPGGIVSLSTEWKLSGDGWGWANVVLFDEETLMKYIVEPSGCELVDKPDFSFDGDIDDAVTINQVVSGQAPVEYVLKEGQFVFTSVHVALRRKG
jgi:SAM-dependent methyltransferase